MATHIILRIENNTDTMLDSYSEHHPQYTPDMDLVFLKQRNRLHLSPQKTEELVKRREVFLCKKYNPETNKLTAIYIKVPSTLSINLKGNEQDNQETWSRFPWKLVRLSTSPMRLITKGFFSTRGFAPALKDERIKEIISISSPTLRNKIKANIEEALNPKSGQGLLQKYQKKLDKLHQQSTAPSIFNCLYLFGSNTLSQQTKLQDKITAIEDILEAFNNLKKAEQVFHDDNIQKLADMVHNDSSFKQALKSAFNKATLKENGYSTNKSREVIECIAEFCLKPALHTPEAAPERTLSMA